MTVLLVLRDGAVVGSSPVAAFEEDGVGGGLMEDAVTRWLRKLGAFREPAVHPGRPEHGRSGGASDSVGAIDALFLRLVMPL